MNAPKPENALLLFPLVFYCMYVLMTPPTADDVWWRLYSGEQTLQTGEIVRENTWAYRDHGHTWVNHAAGQDVLLALSHRALGNTGILLPYLLSGLLTAFFLLRPRHRFDLAWAMFLPPLLATHHALRPFVISDLFLCAAVFLAVRLHDEDSPRIFNFLPAWAIFFVWGQLHGAVWVGFAVFTLLSIRWRQLPGRQELRRTWPLLLVFAGALANPAGLHGLGLAVRYAVFSPPWLGQLTEWQPAPPPVFGCAGAFLAGLLFAWKRSRLPFARLLPLAALLPAAAQVRHLLLPALSGAAMLLALRIPPASGVAVLPPRRTMALRFSIGLTLALTASFLHASRIEDDRFYPAGLYRQMARQCRLDAPLRIFAPHAWGGSLTWHFQGRLQPYMDARNDCFSRETFGRYHAIMHLRENWYSLLMEDRPDGALLPVEHPLVPKLLRAGWVPGARWRYKRFLVAPHRSRTLCRRPPGAADARDHAIFPKKYPAM